MRVRTDFILLTLLWSFQWRGIKTGSVICESTGLCQESDSQCTYDSLQLCFPDSGLILYRYASYEPSGQQEDYEIKTSTLQACSVSTSFTNISLQDVRVVYVSINPTYLSICITWSLARNSGFYGGLEIRVLSLHNRIQYRYCVRNAHRMKMCINNFMYEDLSGYEAVEVLPYPLASDDNEDIFKKSELLRGDIDGCADVEHGGTICNIKQYLIPTNLVVVSAICEDHTKRLNISWGRPIIDNSSVLPMEYYVYLYNGRVMLYKFKVENSLQLMLHNLSASYNYSVGVQAYHKCAGLGDYATTGSDRFGCGRPKLENENFIGQCASFSKDEGVTFEVKETHKETHKVEIPTNPNTANIIVWTSALCTIAVIIGIIVLIISLLFLLRYCGKKMHFLVHPQKTHCKVFVFCSPSMSQASLENVQKHVICSLLEYFDIVTPSDISSGNVSMWMEESMNSVDSILIVGNKDLCHDWEMEERSPILNSLELIVSAAVSQNTIGKFCFVSIADSMNDVSVPNNLYLKLMPIFLMGQKKFEIEKLYQFVTKSRGIEFSI